MSDAEINVAIETATKLIPNQESGSAMVAGYCAEDGTTALVYALECLRGGSVQEAVWPAQCAHASLNEFVIERENIDTNKTGWQYQVLSHPLVQAEFARELRDLDDLLREVLTN